MEIYIADGFVMTIDKTKQKRNRTVQVHLESLSFPIKIRDWSPK